MRGANVSLVALALAAGLWTIGQAAPAAAQNYGQNQQGSGLTVRSSPAASDVVPCQPAGSYTQGCTVGGIAALGGGVPVVCTGVAAIDTAAIQAAITAGGAVIQVAPGTCVASGLTSPNPAIGQIIRGAGVGVTTIKPPAGATGFVLTTGTSSSYAPGWSIQDLTIDLANMSDVSTNGAINQQGVYGAQYIAVAVINDGANKRAWLFNNGAELSGMYDTLGNILDFEGVSGGSNDNPTTINVVGHNGGHAIMSWANGIHFVGGAFQGSGVTHFAISNSGDINISTDVEGSGAYVTCTNFTYAIRLHSELGGLTGATEPTGCGLNSELEDDKPSDQSYAATFRSWGGDHLNAHGTNGYSQWLSGATGYLYHLDIGRTGSDGSFEISAVAGDISPAAAPGDTALNAIGSGNCAWLDQNYTDGLAVCATYIQPYKPFSLLTFKPLTDGQYLTLENAAGLGFEVVVSNSTVGSSLHSFGRGMSLFGYSDNFSTQTWTISSATGAINTAGAVTAAGGLITGPVAYASLPASPVAGQRAAVGNTSTCAKNTAVNGSGSTFCAVIYNGTAWVGE